MLRIHETTLQMLPGDWIEKTQIIEQQINVQPGHAADLTI